MSQKPLPHSIPADLQKALDSSRAMKKAWNDITPLARNEWICWIISVKKEETRKEHLERAQEELIGGKRRPCCWVGCVHRTDKSLSAAQKWMMGKGKK
jgi:uncharacterized protein YdeI (YjbR/CyaY-like superfamily)